MVGSDYQLEESDLDRVLRHLAVSSRLLRLLGLFLVLLTFGALFALLMFFTALRLRLSALQTIPPTEYILILLILCVTSILTAVTFEVRRRRADVWFEEVSDELHWRRGKAKSEDYSDSRPRLQSRLVLREYARATELPFIPGRAAPAICVAANVLFVAISVALAGGL
jgi:hypothetical protein